MGKGSDGYIVQIKQVQHSNSNSLCHTKFLQENGDLRYLKRL